LTTKKPVNITFDDLSELAFEEQHVFLTGFLYSTPDAKWVLAKDPHLKSCCLLKDGKAKNKIVISFLKNPSPSTMSAVTIAGDLVYSETESAFQMRNANLIDACPLETYFIASFGIALVFGFIFLISRYTSSKKV